MLRNLGRLTTQIAFGIWMITGGASLAQTVRGGLAGTITDSTGAVIVGAHVQAKNQHTGDRSTAITTSAGTYRFPELPLGTYDVTVSASGFRNSVSTGVLVQIQQVTALNITIEAGATTETVTVNANAPTIQTETSDMGGIVAASRLLNFHWHSVG